jgi:SAM-dependent methyltransferase
LTSEDLSRAFYRRLGAEGLAKRTRREWDDLIVARLVEEVFAGARILDVGCGYGRITIPLSRRGFRIKGLDLSPELIAAAQQQAKAEGLEMASTVGAMTELPYEDSCFDAVICLWSAFNELLDESEQLAALREMHRVLTEGGLAVVEGPPYTEATKQEIESGRRRGPAHRIAWDVVEGILNPHYRHDESSLRRLCETLGMVDFMTSTESWADRDRLVLRIRKALPAV